MSDNTVMCGRPAAFYMSGIGRRTVPVCIDCAEKGQAICNALGVPAMLDPDVPEGTECAQRIKRETRKEGADGQ